MICSVTEVILLAKLTGFVKQMLTAGLFGATLETDLILLSQTFAGNLQYLFSQVLLTAFTATYIHIHEEGGNTQRFVSDTLKVVFSNCRRSNGSYHYWQEKSALLRFYGANGAQAENAPRSAVGRAAHHPHAPAGRKTNKLRLTGQMTRQPCILHTGSTLTFLSAAFCQDTRIP